LYGNWKLTVHAGVEALHNATVLLAADATYGSFAIVSLGQTAHRFLASKEDCLLGHHSAYLSDPSRLLDELANQNIMSEVGAAG
jgi:hypothetical protein